MLTPFTNRLDTVTYSFAFCGSWQAAKFKQLYFSFKSPFKYPSMISSSDSVKAGEVVMRLSSELSILRPRWSCPPKPSDPAPKIRALTTRRITRLVRFKLNTWKNLGGVEKIVNDNKARRVVRFLSERWSFLLDCWLCFWQTNLVLIERGCSRPVIPASAFCLFQFARGYPLGHCWLLQLACLK